MIDFMKKVVLFCIIHLFFLSCSAQKDNHNSQNFADMQYPIVSKDFEKFDTTFYEQIKSSGFNTSRVETTSSNGDFIEMIKTSSGSTSRAIGKDDYFALTKSYFSNNNIKSKGLYFNVSWGGFKKGTWYEYDDQGNLVKEVNYDTPYQFTFEDILEFCKQNKIPVEKGPILQSTGFHTVINRYTQEDQSNSPIWKIEWLKKHDLIEEITLDGINGKVLDQKETEYRNN